MIYQSFIQKEKTFNLGYFENKIWQYYHHLKQKERNVNLEPKNVYLSLFKLDFEKVWYKKKEL